MREYEFLAIADLNEAQKKALVQIDGAVLVTAGAGSGKTKLLTNRIAYMIEVNGVSPENILAITFTNKAANEMKERVAKITPTGKDVWISTFHSMCVQILKRYIFLMPPYTNSFTIFDDNDSEKVLKEVFAKLNIIDDATKKDVKFHLSNYRNNNMTLTEYASKNSYLNNIDSIVKAIKEYNNSLMKSNALDFDDLLYKTYELLVNNKDVLITYAKRFRYILVDEFQDTNKVQFDLILLLSSYHRNIFVVGDEDQCIYSWRGASFKNLFDFKEKFENVHVFKLEQNYRSTKQILDVANKLIKNNKTRYQKVLWTDTENDFPVDNMTSYNEKEEAEKIAKEIFYSIKGKKYTYKDFAILMRINALSLPFEEKMMEYNIPYIVYGGFKFYERQEIKNVLAYLRIFLNIKDNVAFTRIINFPKRGIGNSTLEKLNEIANKNDLSMMEVVLKLDEFYELTNLKSKLNKFIENYISLTATLNNLSPYDFACELIAKFGIKDFYSQKEEDVEKALNIDALLKSLADYCEANEQATLENYVESVSLVADMDTEESGTNCVKIATVHSVKGLEFKNVYVVGAEETIFPLSRAFGNDKEMEEERRLMYVAVTRAKEKLCLSHCKIRYLYGHNSYMKPSRFIGEMDLGSKYQFMEYNKELDDCYYTPKPVQEKIIYQSSFNRIKQPVKNEVVSNSTTQNKDISIYSIGQSVLHPKFGIGKIINIFYDTKFADIEFKGIGKKTLLLDIAPLKILKGE